jgi:hypothetical protein
MALLLRAGPGESLECSSSAASLYSTRSPQSTALLVADAATPRGACAESVAVNVMPIPG